MKLGVESRQFFFEKDIPPEDIIKSNLEAMFCHLAFRLMDEGIAFRNKPPITMTLELREDYYAFKFVLLTDIEL